MAAILPFPIRQSGDWSESERARLDELAARFADQAGVEVAFGRTDSGDPWCVVLDAHDEVLVHVARVQGDVVVHAAAPDVLVRAHDLRTAVDRVLGSRWLEERADVVVPFASGSRAMQVVTAVLIVGSFTEHHRAEAEPADDWVFAPTRPLKSLARDGQRDDAAKVAVVADAAPAIDLATDLTPATSRSSEAGQPLGTSFDRPTLDADDRPDAGSEIATWLIAGSARPAEPSADIVVGTAGDDELDAGQAPPGRHDLLDGGAGDDRLILDGGTIAIGGDGSDRFVLRTPEPSTAGELTLLGIVVDFETGVDLLTAGTAPSFTIVATLPTRNIFADPNVNLAGLPELPGQQLFADLDGDGRIDGYVLVNSAEPSPALLDAVRQAVAGGAVPPSVIVEPTTGPDLPPPPVEFAAGPNVEPVDAAKPTEGAKPTETATPTAPKVPETAAPIAPPPEPKVEAVPERMAEPAAAPPDEPEARRIAEPAAPEPKGESIDDPAVETAAPGARLATASELEAGPAAPEPDIELSGEPAASSITEAAGTSELPFVGEDSGESAPSSVGEAVDAPPVSVFEAIDPMPAPMLEVI